MAIEIKPIFLIFIGFLIIFIFPSMMSDYIEDTTGEVIIWTSEERCKVDAKEHGFKFVEQEFAGGGLFSSPDNNCWVKNNEGEVFQLW